MHKTIVTLALAFLSLPASASIIAGVQSSANPGVTILTPVEITGASPYYFVDNLIPTNGSGYLFATINIHSIAPGAALVIDGLGRTGNILSDVRINPDLSVTVDGNTSAPNIFSFNTDVLHHEQAIIATPFGVATATTAVTTASLSFFSGSIVGLNGDAEILEWRITATGTVDATISNVTTSSSAPEPSSLMLGITGALLLASLRWSKSSHRKSA